MTPAKIIGQVVAQLRQPVKNISLPTAVFDTICAFVRSDPPFAPREVQRLADSLNKAQKQEKRLSTQLIIVLLAILRRSADCPATERGFAVLIDILDDDDNQAATATQSSSGSQTSRKARIGRYTLPDLTLYFLGSQHMLKKRRQVGLLVLMLVHDCEANQELFTRNLVHLQPIFFNLLRNERDTVLRITAALMYREFHLAGLDLTGFCRAEGVKTSMPAEFEVVLGSASSEDTNERLLWAVTFLDEIQPCLATNRQSMPVHVLRSIFCDFRRAIGINMNVDDGRALFVAGETSTLIVLHRDDAVPFLADIPLSGIESVALGLIDEIGQNGTIISFKKGASDTIFLDGEGHHTDRMKIAVIGKAEQLSQSIIQAKNASQRTAMASEALSPINVSVAQRRAVMIDRSPCAASPIVAGNPRLETEHVVSEGQTRNSRRSARNGRPKEDSTQTRTHATPAYSLHQKSPGDGESHRESDGAQLVSSKQKNKGQQPPRPKQAKARGNVAMFDLPTSDDECSSQHLVGSVTPRSGISHQMGASGSNGRSVSTKSPGKGAGQLTVVPRRAGAVTAHSTAPPHQKPRLPKATAPQPATVERPKRVAKTVATKRIRKTSLDEEDESSNGNQEASTKDVKLRPLTLTDTRIPSPGLQNIAPLSESIEDGAGPEHLIQRGLHPSAGQMLPPPKPLRKVSMQKLTLTTTTSTATPSSVSRPRLSSRTTESPVRVIGTTAVQQKLALMTPKGKLASRMEPPSSDRLTDKVVKSVGDNTVERSAKSASQHVARTKVPQTAKSVRKVITKTSSITAPMAGKRASSPIHVTSDEESLEDISEDEDELPSFNGMGTAQPAHATPAQVASKTSRLLATAKPGFETPQGNFSSEGYPLTDDRLLRKPNLISFGASRPRNRGVIQAAHSSSIQKKTTPAPQLRRLIPQENATRSPEQLAADAEDNGEENVQTLDSDTELKEHTAAQTFQHARGMNRESSANAAQVTEAGSPIEKQRSGSRDGIELGTPALKQRMRRHQYMDLPVTTLDIGKLREKGRRISQQVQHDSLSRTSLARRADVSLHLGAKTTSLSNASPHKAIAEGYQSIRTDSVIRPAVLPDPFVDKNDRSALSSNDGTARTSPKSNSSTEIQIDEVNEDQAILGTAALAIRLEPIQPVPAIRQDYVPKHTSRLVEKPKTPQIELARSHVVELTAPVLLSPVFPGLNNAEASVPDRGAAPKEVLKKARKDKIARKRSKDDEIPPSVTTLHSSKAHDDKRATSRDTIQTGMSQKRRRAFEEDETGDHKRPCDKHNAKRQKQVHFSKSPDDSSSGSSSSDTSTDDGSSEDPDETLVDDGNAEAEQEPPPGEALLREFATFSGTLARPFFSMERKTNSLVQMFLAKISALALPIIDQQDAAGNDFQSGAVKMKKRLFSELQASHGKLVEAESAAKKQRISATNDGPSFWKNVDAELQAAESLCLSAFA